MRDPAFQKNLYNDLKKFNFPVLIINGALDIVSASALQRLRSSLPKSKLETFTESGHFPFVEETKKFNKVVEQFIRKKK
jgi:pimeloyl-ACP methyl ester carboxylesterase